MLITEAKGSSKGTGNKTDPNAHVHSDFNFPREHRVLFYKGI